MGARRLTKSLLVRGKKYFSAQTNQILEVNMNFICRLARWLGFSSRLKVEKTLDEHKTHQQTLEEIERIKARALYLSRGL